MKLLRLTICFVTMFTMSQKGLCQDLSDNKKVAKFYMEEVVNKQNLESLNKVFADSFLVHILIDSTEEKKSISDQKKFLEYLFKAFPDIHYSVGDVLAEGDRIAMRVTLTATHKNEFWGHKPMGNRINYLSEIFFFRFSNGKVVECWVQLDLHHLFRQLKDEKKS